MSDESQLQIARKNEESSLVLSAQASLIARGRRDAALITLPCNKCGERKELVFAGCVCASCSDGLDERWAGSPATDWVLIASSGKRLPNDPSVATWLEFLKKFDELKGGPEAGGVSSEEPAAETPPKVVPSSGRKRLWPPLYWLSAPSREAEFGFEQTTDGVYLYVYPNTTYAHIKLHWAKSNPTSNPAIGEALLRRQSPFSPRIRQIPPWDRRNPGAI